ncbi:MULTISPECIES: glycoside hydrolase family 43 protein [Caproicibacterium]|uniref:Glycoside hydrolase 43 family protein n=1 Tax=Caproicibacterium argilliputei TaxID=3030016 RepID=A0AA97D9P6_9FIRM|nr:glycoside hydrolase 43 family protein [Caproicibacterium argilliputei]WOC31630.1 glycoside hydrolase 43 family protein [Caproicibacterium argilliputei]
MQEQNNTVCQNPILWMDFPDPDVIRVGDTYYMVSTTMHFMPGAVILRSYDLAHWETASYVYDTLDSTPAQRLEGEQTAYGKGMWAASIRWHNGKFYVCFVANDTHKTYLYQAENVEGPWEKQTIAGFYHDSSLLFDDDGRVYIVYGNTEIHLTELNRELTGPEPGGLDRVIVREQENVCLGYEGSHFYKINGRYYVFFIHWLKDGSNRRVEACFAADSPDGTFRGGNVLDDDLGFCNSGVAQGGIVDTPDGKWYGVLFQDRGAVGRVPVLVPVEWKDGFPVFGIDGKVPQQLSVSSTRPGYTYRPVAGGDDFQVQPDRQGRIRLKDFWQWNHEPDNALWSVTERPGHLRLTTGKCSSDVEHAVNTLTQRMHGPACSASVTLDASQLQEGDFAGLCAFQGCYGYLAVTKENGRLYLVMTAKEAQNASLQADPKRAPTEYARVALNSTEVRLKLSCNFADEQDEAAFFYEDGGAWKQLGPTHKLYFKMDHFTGCRFALFQFATKTAGGTADFSAFQYD